MNRLHRQKREQEQILQDSIEKILSGERSLEEILAQYPDRADNLRPILETVVWLLQRRDDLSPRPAFVNASHRRLVMQLKTMQLSRMHRSLIHFLQVLKKKQVIRLAFFLLIITFVFTGSKAASAAAFSIPGDIAYPIKVTLEKMQLGVSINEASATRLQVVFAQKRLIEMQSLILEGRYEYIPQTTLEFNKDILMAINSIERLSDRSPDQAQQLAVSLKNALSIQVLTLDVMLQMVPETDKPAVREMIHISNDGAVQLSGFLAQPVKYLP